jgi:hypothetical protein
MRAGGLVHWHVWRATETSGTYAAGARIELQKRCVAKNSRASAGDTVQLVFVESLSPADGHLLQAELASCT